MTDYSKFKLYQSTLNVNKLVLVYDDYGWSCTYNNLSPAIEQLLSPCGGWETCTFPNDIGEYITSLDILLKTNPEYFL